MAQATKPKLGFKRGGHVQGPGTETSDSIPALLSDGEYVLPADTVRAIGVKKLDQLKNATHTPSGNAMGFIPGFADGGVPGLIGQDRLDKQNAETAASSIVHDASQQAGQSQLDAMNKPAEAPATAAAAATSKPAATPGMIGGDRLNQQNAETAKSSITAPTEPPTTQPAQTPAPDPTLAAKSVSSAPGLGSLPSSAPVTRVGNSFSNFNATNEDPAYRGLKMDPNDPGNQRAMQSVRPFAARGFASGGLVEDERKKLLSQIPGSAPEGWTGGSGVPVTGNEFTRNVVNTAQALAPVAPVASGAAKLAAAAPKVLASPIAQTAIAYGVPAVGGVALLNAASDKPANAPVSKPNVTDAQRPVNPDRLPPVEAQTNTAPDGSPLSPASDAPVQAQQPTGAVIQPPQPAAGFIPAQIRHSGNDWQARNDLRNLEVSASSITAAPNGKEMMAYRAGLEADKALKEGKNPAIESQNRDAAFMDRTQVGANAANYRADIANNIAQQRVNQEGVKLGFESDAAKQLQTLRNQIMTEKDDKKRSVLLDNYQTLTGKFPRPDAAERLTVVQLPDTIDPETKQVMRGGQAAFGADGRRIDLGGGQQQALPAGLVVGAPTKQASGTYQVGNKSVTIKDGKVTEIK